MLLSFENRFAHIDVTIHDATRRAEYAEAFYLHLPVDRFGFGLCREGSAWMTDVDRRSCPGRFPEHFAHDGAGHTCGSAGAETATNLNGLVRLEHEQSANDEVYILGFHRLTVDGLIVCRRADQEEERHVGAFGFGVLGLFDQAAHQGGMATDFLDGFHKWFVGLDLIWRLGPLQVQARRMYEDYRIAGIDDGYGVFDPIYLNNVFGVSGRHKLAGYTADDIRPIHSDLCASAWHAIDGQVAVNHGFAALYRNFSHQNLVAVSHADAHGGNWLHRLHQAFVDGERPDRRRNIPAVGVVVDKGGVEAHLGEGVVDIGARLARR